MSKTKNTTRETAQEYKTCPKCGCTLYANDDRPCKWEGETAQGKPELPDPEAVYQAAIREWNYGKPQAEHSPLPWRMRNATHGWIVRADNSHLVVMTRGEDLVDEVNAKLIVASVNHADKLAEALREAAAALDPSKYPHTIAQAREALAAYEKARQ